MDPLGLRPSGAIIKPVLSSTAQRRVSHDLVIADDQQETTKQDYAKLVYRGTVGLIPDDRCLSHCRPMKELEGIFCLFTFTLTYM